MQYARRGAKTDRQTDRQMREKKETDRQTERKTETGRHILDRQTDLGVREIGRS